MCVCMFVYAHMPLCICGGQRTTWGVYSSFPPCGFWILNLGHLYLAANDFTCWAICRMEQVFLLILRRKDYCDTVCYFIPAAASCILCLSCLLIASFSLVFGLVLSSSVYQNPLLMLPIIDCIEWLTWKQN